VSTAGGVEYMFCHTMISPCNLSLLCWIGPTPMAHTPLRGPVCLPHLFLLYN
jgi:hypothetical protein